MLSRSVFPRKDMILVRPEELLELFTHVATIFPSVWREPGARLPLVFSRHQPNDCRQDGIRAAVHNEVVGRL